MGRQEPPTLLPEGCMGSCSGALGSLTRSNLHLARARGAPPLSSQLWAKGRSPRTRPAPQDPCRSSALHSWELGRNLDCGAPSQRQRRALAHVTQGCLHRSCSVKAVATAHLPCKCFRECEIPGKTAGSDGPVRGGQGCGCECTSWGGNVPKVHGGREWPPAFVMIITLHTQVGDLFPSRGGFEKTWQPHEGGIRGASV